MAVYDNVKVKVFIHFANTNTEASAVGTLARDIKEYSGTLIRETKTHKFARTHNGKIKKIKK